MNADVRDESGAVLVPGLVMCCILAGAIWYVAGIAEACLFRERVQEAADAAAFTAASVNARGMNLIVMLNIVMAAILSIRVVLKALYLIVLIVYGIVALISWVPGMQPVFAAVSAARTTLDNTIRSIRAPMNGALAAISRSQDAIATATPFVAIAASGVVGLRYRPTVEGAVAYQEPEMLLTGGGLPVEPDGSPKLCRTAGQSLGDLLNLLLEPLGLGVAGRFVGGLLGSVAALSPEYFCEIPFGVRAHDAALLELEAQAQKQGSGECDKAKEAAGDAGAAEDGGAFDAGACEAQQQNAVQSAIQDVVMEAAGELGPDMAFAAKRTPFSLGNGCDDQQSTAVAFGDQTRGQGRSGRGVAVAGLGRGSPPRTVDPGDWAFNATAQGDFYYDCQGPWEGDGCNREGKSESGHVPPGYLTGEAGEAMWHFGWRPRVRLFNNSSTPLQGTLSDIGKRIQGRYAQEGAGTARTPGNQALFEELSKQPDEGPFGIFAH